MPMHIPACRGAPWRARVGDQSGTPRTGGITDDIAFVPAGYRRRVMTRAIRMRPHVMNEILAPTR
jgi:hypothetical protein